MQICSVTLPINNEKINLLKFTRNLKVHSLSFIHNLSINYSARAMIVKLGVLSIPELIRKFRLIESINNNDNKLVQAASNITGQDSTLWKQLVHWRASLFVL